MRRSASRSERSCPKPAAEGVPNLLEKRRWSAVMTLKHGGLRSCDAAASHRAAGGAGPSIEGARTYASGTSRGAAARFRAFRPAIRNMIMQFALGAF